MTYLAFVHLNHCGIDLYDAYNLDYPNHGCALQCPECALCFFFVMPEENWYAYHFDGVPSGSDDIQSRSHCRYDEWRIESSVPGNE